MSTQHRSPDRSTGGRVPGLNGSAPSTGQQARSADGQEESGQKLLDAERLFKKALGEISEGLARHKAGEHVDLAQFVTVSRSSQLAREILLLKRMDDVMDGIAGLKQLVDEGDRKVAARLDVVDRRLQERMKGPAQQDAPEFALEPTEEGGERTRRQRDQVFGKSHPMWREVAEYTRTKVRAEGAPLPAKDVAQIIKIRYPQFEVHGKSVPNRLVAMGFRRVYRKNSSKALFWFGDTTPDGFN